MKMYQFLGWVVGIVGILLIIGIGVFRLLGLI